MTISAPLFALAGRGVEVKRARDLIASIGGVITKKEQEADYLVVLKGAGRRKVESYLNNRRNVVANKATGTKDTKDTQTPRSGGLLLLDTLEEWSRLKKFPPRYISIQEIDEKILFGSAAGCERSLNVSRKRILKTSANNDSASSYPKCNSLRNSSSQDTARSVSPTRLSLTSPLLSSPAPPLMKSAAVHITSDVVFRTRRQIDSERKGLLVEKDEISLDIKKGKSTKDVKLCEAKTNGSVEVVNPMRAAFRKRPKPEWDTYFADVSRDTGGNSGGGKLDYAQHEERIKAISTSSGSCRIDSNNLMNSCHADFCGNGVDATAAKSFLTRSSTKYISSSDNLSDDTAAHVVGATKNGLALAFDLTRRDFKEDLISSNSFTCSQKNNTEDKKKFATEPKKMGQLQVQQQQSKLDKKLHSLHSSSISGTLNMANKKELFSADNQCKLRSSKSGCYEEPREKASSSRHASNKILGTSSLASSPCVHEAGGPRSANGPKNLPKATTTLLTGRKSTTSTHFVKPSHTSSRLSVNTTTAANANSKTGVAGATHSNSLLRRVRQSTYCRGIPEEACATVLQQIVDHACPVSFNGIAGLEVCKRILHEAIILPAKCPQLFTGLRRPCSGLLLFGPPGNGKTLLASAVASECNTTFFSISASAITSKWVGEGEKMVRALFAVARALAPSTIFIDEIDALLQARGGQHEGEGSRRIKTEFLVQMDGAGNDSSEARILVMGATNRPFDLDEAIIRRFQKRVFVPLPDAPARAQILHSLLNTEETPNTFTTDEWQRIVTLTENYSGHDLRQLCEEAAMIPVRELIEEKLRKGEDLAAQTYSNDLLRPLTLRDLTLCVKARHPSCCLKQLKMLSDWSDTYGSS